jgi:phosphoethanolamine N-methyltransferase
MSSTAETATNSESSKQGFDNNGQYSRKSILRYEMIFGPGYISTGGHDTTLYLTSKVPFALKSGARVLDVGSGIGGAAFHLAKQYGADVTGIDLAEEMDGIARERIQSAGVGDSVRFILGDVLEESFPQPFDVIWSRDALMHVHDKPRLFKRLYDLLADGGTLVVTDYARGEGQRSPEFEEYIRKTGYHVVSPRQYGELLRQAGFVDVQVEDATDRFVQILESEMGRLDTERASFLGSFSEEDLNYLKDRWAMKVGFCQAGDMKWGIYVARKRAS